MILDLNKIPEGWFLQDFRELRTPILYAGDHHKPTGVWYCALQWVEGGGRLSEGRGPNPISALDSAVERVKTVDDPVVKNRSRRNA